MQSQISASTWFFNQQRAKGRRPFTWIRHLIKFLLMSFLFSKSSGPDPSMQISLRPWLMWGFCVTIKFLIASVSEFLMISTTLLDLSISKFWLLNEHVLLLNQIRLDHYCKIHMSKWGFLLDSFHLLFSDLGKEVMKILKYYVIMFVYFFTEYAFARQDWQNRNLKIIKNNTKDKTKTT